MVIKWRVEDGNLQILFQNKEDIKQFIQQVIKGPAELLGLEVIIKDKPLEIIIREGGRKHPSYEVVRL